VHHRRDWQHRRGPRRNADLRRISRRRRDRPARHPRAIRHGRNGYKRIRISFDIAGDATPQKLREIIEQSRARSAVYDVFANGVPVDVDVNVI
jgi:hypothetical protein